MRRKHYFRKTIENGAVEQLAFLAEHYREAGTLVTPDVGMHEVTASQLVNRWNASHQASRFVYWL